MTSKAELRVLARNREPPTPGHNALVCAGLAEWLEPRLPAQVLSYLPMPGEVDLSLLVALLPLAKWALTRTPTHGSLTIHPMESELETHRYGFRQPVAGSPAISDAEIDVVLVPGLLFDSHGERLGRGEGYYDSLLERLGHVERVGVTIESWVIERIPLEAHDRSVGWLATETGVRPAG